MSEQLRKLWECPECGRAFTRNYRHLHSTDSPPFFKRVPLIEKLYTEVTTA